MIKDEISNLVTKRNELFKDEELYHHEIDTLAQEIYSKLEQNFSNLTIDFIFETLTSLGGCPNLLYDDDGRWAVTDDGYQNVNTTEEAIDIKTSFFVEKEKWEDTIYKALENYFKRSSEE